MNREELRIKKLKHWCDQKIKEHLNEDWRGVISDILTVVDRLGKAEKVIEFYANADYGCEIDRKGYLDSSDWVSVDSEIMKDQGSVASSYLNQYKKD